MKSFCSIYFSSNPSSTTKNGATIIAEGYGLKLIHGPSTKIIIPLWPTYYMPQNPQCTFSPTALKHYQCYPTVITTHLLALDITMINGAQICLSSLHCFILTSI